MAVLFEKVANGRVYQVRSAGNSRRLYTDGVFHSQYNPNHIITGSVWDLLFLPSQFYAKGALKRVLVLGVGGIGNVWVWFIFAGIPLTIYLTTIWYRR